MNSPACTTSAIPVAASYDGVYAPAYSDVCADPAPQAHWITCFSNIDNCDFFLAAPGYDVSVGGYDHCDGTSMATPVVSGVAALMWSKMGCSSLSAGQVRNILFSTADPYSWAYPYCDFWQPDHVNALAAVNAVPSASTSGTGDLDCDGTVSGDDFVAFVQCMTVPNGGPTQGFCVAADFSESRADEDVDLQDFAVFQQIVEGYGEGACCHIDGTCTEETVADCRAEFYAEYQGHGTTCATTDCPIHPWGACCNLSSGECTISAEDDCVWSGGAYQGDGTDCDAILCPVVRYDNRIDPLTTFITSPTGILADDATLSGSGGGMLSQYTIGVFGGYGGSFDATISIHTGYPPSAGNLISGTSFTYYNQPDNGSPVFLSPIVNPAVYIPHSVWIKVDFHGNTAAGWFRAEAAEVGYTQDYYARYDPPWTGYWWEGNPWAGMWASIACVVGKDDSGEGLEPVAEVLSDIRLAPEANRLPQSIGRPTAAAAKQRPRAQQAVVKLVSSSDGAALQPGDVVEWEARVQIDAEDSAGLALVCVDLVHDEANPEIFSIPRAFATEGMNNFRRPDGIDNPDEFGDSAFGGTPRDGDLVQIGGAQNTIGVACEPAGAETAIELSVGYADQTIAVGSFVAPATHGVYRFYLADARVNCLQTMTPQPLPPDHWPVTPAQVAYDDAELSFTVGDVSCLAGDVNGDGSISGEDIQPFVTTYLNPDQASPFCRCASDLDGDGLFQMADVTLFVLSLTETTCSRGDMTNDGSLDGRDVSAFVAAVLAADTLPLRQFCAADVNLDARVDENDIAPFVSAILNAD